MQVPAPLGWNGAGGREHAPSRTSQCGAYWAIAAALVVLSVVMTWPMSAHLADRMLGAPAPGDSFYYIFLMRWLKDGIFGGVPWSRLLFDPGMFYPFGYNLTLSETTLSNTLVALPFAALWGEVTAYNLTLLLSFVLSGLGAYLLVLYHTRSRAAAWVGAAIFAFSPYRLSHLGAGHLPLMGTQWLPLLLLYLDKTVMKRQASNAVLAAVFYALGALASWYYAYIFALAGLSYVLLRGRPWRRYLWQRQFMWRVLVFMLVVVVLVGPLALATTQGWSEGERPHSLRYIDQFSASPLDYVYPNVLQPLWGARLICYYAQNLNENVLYLGLVPVLLSLVALWRRRSEAVRVFAWLSLIFIVVALGTTLHWKNAPVYIPVPTWLERTFTVGVGLLTGRLAIYPISSYSLRVAGHIYVPLPTLLLNLYLPLFSAMRVWTRFGLVAILGIAVLAGFGLRELGKVAVLRRLTAWPAVLPALSLILVLFEFAPLPFALGSSSVQARPVDEWLAAQSGDWAIMEFPVTKALSGRPLYMATTHGKNISFGYGTFFPRAFSEQRQVLETFPSPESIALLRTWGVRYVLVGAVSYGVEWAQIETRLMSSAGLRYVLTLDDRPVYEGDRLLHLLPGTERAFVVDRIYVYEVL